MAKTITDSQMIGAQGEVFVNERANAMGFMFTPHGTLDAGIDGFLEIRDTETGHATGQLIAVQVKAKTGGLYQRETDSGFEYLMKEDDLAYWRGSNLPVIIVLVDLGRKTAYWKNVDEGEGPDRRRLHIDKVGDVFDTSARDALSDLCVAKSSFGTYFPPSNSGERGHLNMLEVVLPERIFLAASLFKSGRDALVELLEHEDRPPSDWVVRGRQFTSFRDPREGVLSRIVDVGTVEEFSTEEIAFPDSESDEYVFIDLLRRTLGSQFEDVLAFSREQRAFYFLPEPEKIVRAYLYRSLKQQATATVVQKYEKNGRVSYVRHHAFEPRFWRIDDQWFLSVTPTFVFTWDGFRPDKFASSRLAGKKQRENNSALVGQFVMWCHLLTGPEELQSTASLFESDMHAEQILGFKRLDSLSLQRAVPDDLWRSTELVTPDSPDLWRIPK